MTHAFNRPDGEFDANAGPSWYSGYFGVAVAMGVAIVVERLTGNAIVAAAIPYAAVAWEPFRCALWLASADPEAARGRTCFRFYLAMAFWNAACSAFATFLLFLLIDLSTGEAPNMDALATTMLTLFGGASLSSVIGIVAIASALRGRLRIWAHPGVRRRSRGDFGRLGDRDRRPWRFNYAKFVVVTSLVFPWLAVGTCLLMWGPAPEHPNDICPAAIVVMILFLFVGPLALIPVCAWLSSRIIAPTPADCWPPGGADGE